MSNYNLFGILGILVVLLFFILIGLIIYSLILFIQLSNLKIRALNIYITENEKED